MITSSGRPSAEAIDLMRRALREGRPLEEEYPLIFRSEMPGRVLSLEVEGRVVSTCATLVRDLRCGDHVLRVGLIGSVATEPDARGRGHASRLLERAEAQLAEEGAPLVLLWADEPGFYEKRGYHAVGSEDLYVLRALRELQSSGAADTPPGGVRALGTDPRTKDVDAVHAMYRAHESGADRSRAETEALLTCPGMTVTLHGEPGEADAYACYGRGEDFDGVVHEWGGAPEGLRAILRALCAQRREDSEGRDLFMMGPLDSAFLRTFLPEASLARRGVLAMGRVVDGEGLARWLRSEGLARISCVTPDPEHPKGPSYVLSGTRGQIGLGDDDLLALTLSAAGERGFHDELERRLGVELEGLPLPLYLWGLDSI